MFSNDRRWTSIFLPGLRYHLLALTFFTVVFAIIPFTIYAHSGEDWDFPFQELLSVAALGLVLFIGFALVLRLVAGLHVGAAATAAVIMFGLGAFLLLAHVYAPIQIGPLDGSRIKSTEPIFYTLVEVALLAALIPVLLQLQRGRGLMIAELFSVALLLVSFGYAGVLMLADHQHAEASPAPGGQAGLATAAPRPHALAADSADITGNVYQIVLDRMQTDAFLDALEHNGTQDVFAGFDLFKNNVSNYIWTLQSAASYFTGTYFKGGDYSHWIHGWQTSEGLFPTLVGRGYRISMYAPIASWKTKYVDRFHYDVDIYQQQTGFAHAGLYDLLQIWLASLAPNLLTNEALPLAADLADPVFELLTGRRRPLSGTEGLHQVAGVLVLRQLVREEAARAPNGEYVYAHVLLPHGPHVLDRDCRYAGPTGKRAVPLKAVQGYLLQAQCSLGLVASFLQELKRLGRYQAATIVIHGDTGDWMPLGETRKNTGQILGYRQAKLLSYVQALLMIKRPHAEGPLRVVETPTQLVDLYPTLLDVLDLGPPPVDLYGRSIYAKEADQPREVRIAFDPKAPNLQGSDLVEVRIDEPWHPRSSPLTVLGPARDPATTSTDAGR